MTHLPSAWSAIHDVCAQAPPGLAHYADLVTGWVKWGVLAAIIIAGFISIGAIVIGRIFGHHHASRMGAMGLAVTIICAILFVTIYGVLHGITGAGC